MTIDIQNINNNLPINIQNDEITNNKKNIMTIFLKPMKYMVILNLIPCCLKILQSLRIVLNLFQMFYIYMIIIWNYYS